MSEQKPEPGDEQDFGEEALAKLRAGKRFVRRFAGEFRQFAVRGNVIDLAVGVIIGAAFGAITTSLVNDIFMPLLGLLTRGISIADLALPLGVGEDAALLRYGAFLGAILNFMIIALSVFLFIRVINRLRQPKPAPAPPPPPPRKCPYCQTVIDPAAVRCPACTSRLDE